MKQICAKSATGFYFWLTLFVDTTHPSHREWITGWLENNMHLKLISPSLVLVILVENEYIFFGFGFKMLVWVYCLFQALDSS